MIKLEHQGCFTQGHGLEGYLWYPPSEAIEAAMEIFMEARHKRIYVSHVTICPRLMTHIWRNVLGKDAELIFTIPVGLHVFPNTFHETLCIYIILTITTEIN